MYKHATPFLLRMNTYYQMSVVHLLVVLFLYLNQLYNLLYFGVWIPQTSDTQMTPLKGCLVAHPHSPRHTCGCYSALLVFGWGISQVSHSNATTALCVNFHHSCGGRNARHTRHNFGGRATPAVACEGRKPNSP